MAINQMQHYPIGNSRVRLSWGRSQTDKTVIGAYRSPQQTNSYIGGMTPTTGYGTYTPTTPVATTPVTPIQPQSSTPLVDSLDPIPVQRMNEIFISNKEALIERAESESNWIGIYAQ